MAVKDQSYCRLCGSALNTLEIDRRLCIVCEEYAQHMGGRKEKDLDQVVTSLMKEPVFRQSQRHLQ